MGTPTNKNTQSLLKTQLEFISNGILFLLIKNFDFVIHNKIASQYKMQISEYLLFKGNIGVFMLFIYDPIQIIG